MEAGLLRRSDRLLPKLTGQTTSVPGDEGKAKPGVGFAGSHNVSLLHLQTLRCFPEEGARAVVWHAFGCWILMHGHCWPLWTECLRAQYS